MGEHGGVTADPSCNNMGNMSPSEYVDTVALVRVESGTADEDSH